MSKRIVKQILKMTLPANKAAPAPPVGPRLGQMGVNIMQFCKEFNSATAEYVDGTPLTTKITAYTDRSASFKIRSPPVSYMLMKAAGIEKGASRPSNETVGTVSLKHIYEIAIVKKTDLHLSHLSLEALCKSIIATSRTCGIAVENPPDHLLAASLQDLEGPSSHQQ